MIRQFLAPLLAVVLLAVLPLVALAQTANTPDYEAWNTTATRAESAIEAARASDIAFESLRGQVAAWREEFSAAQTLNKARITTLTEQIAALGVVEEGAQEEAEITERREELNAQLSAARAPVLRAEEAFTRADGIISEIDRIIRDRQTNELLSLGPTPLNPVNWPGAIEALFSTGQSVINEFVNAWASPVQRSEFYVDLPAILFLVALAVLLILRGRRWIEYLGDHMRRTLGGGFGVWEFLVSLGKILIPLAGLYILVEALFLTNMIGLRGTILIEPIPLWGAILLGARWLGDRVFPRRDNSPYLEMLDVDRLAARRAINVMAILYVVYLALNLLETYESFAAADVAVLNFPIMVLSAVTLFRFATVIMRSKPYQHAREEEPVFRAGLVIIVGRVLAGVAIVAPVLAGIGYGSAAAAILFPTQLTLALIGVVMVLQHFVGDVFALLAREREGVRDSLIPVLLSILIWLLVLPLFALIWGARVTNLTELWAQFRSGFSIGETTISPTDFIVFILIFTIGYMMTRLVQGALKVSVLPRTRIDTGGRNAIVSGIGYVGIFLAALIAVSGAGIDLSSLALVAGALSVGIGFGLQNIVSNFVSGIILLIERPISEGDWIEVNGQMGTVRNISVRSTRVETFDRSDVILPNSDLISGTVTNYTRSNNVGRIILSVGVAYGTDTKRVEAILREIAEAHPMVMVDPPPGIVFQGFGADALDFEIRLILRDINWGLTVRSEVNHAIAERFAAEGIEIPFAQRDIWLRNPEALRAAAASGDTTDES